MLSLRKLCLHTHRTQFDLTWVDLRLSERDSDCCLEFSSSLPRWHLLIVPIYFYRGKFKTEEGVRHTANTCGEKVVSRYSERCCWFEIGDCRESCRWLLYAQLNFLSLLLSPQSFYCIYRFFCCDHYRWNYKWLGYQYSYYCLYLSTVVLWILVVDLRVM